MGGEKKGIFPLEFYCWIERLPQLTLFPHWMQTLGVFSKWEQRGVFNPIFLSFFPFLCKFTRNFWDFIALGMCFQRKLDALDPEQFQRRRSGICSFCKELLQVFQGIWDVLGASWEVLPELYSHQTQLNPGSTGNYP